MREDRYNHVLLVAICLKIMMVLTFIIMTLIIIVDGAFSEQPVMFQSGGGIVRFPDGSIWYSTTNPVPFVPPFPSPTIWLSFDNQSECESGYYADIGITSNYYGTNVTANAMPTWDNNALLLNGSTQFVQVAGFGNAAGHFNTASNFTFSMWAIALTDHNFPTFGKPTDVGAHGPAFAISSNSICAEYYRIYSATNLTVSYADNTDNLWHHYVYQYAGAASPSNDARLWIYKDNVLVGATTNNTLISGNFDSSVGYLNLGLWHGVSATKMYKGAIDDFRLYDGTNLTLAELTNLYTTGLVYHATGAHAWEDPLTNDCALLLDMQRIWSASTIDRISNAIALRKPSGSTGPEACMSAISQNGNINQYFNLDGNDDYLLISDDSRSDLNTNFTLAAWIRPDESNKVGAIIGKFWDGSTRAWEYFVNTDKTNWNMLLHFYTTGDIYVREYPPTVPRTHPFHQWGHVALSRDANTWSFYYNGILQTNVVQAGNIAGNNQDLHIGKGGHSSLADYNIFPGDIDEVQILNYASTSNQIYNLYMNTNPTNNLRWP